MVHTAKPSTIEDIFALSDHAIEAMADADPMMATALGVAGRDHRWPDLTLAGHLARRHLAAELLALADSLNPRNADEDLARRVLMDDLGEQVALHDTGDHLRDLNNIASTFQGLKSAIELMPKADKDDWSRVLVRLETIDAPLRGYRECLAEGLAQGMPVAARQVLAAIEEGKLTAGAESPLRGLESSFSTSGIDDDGMRDRLTAAVDSTCRAYGELTAWLETEYLPHATPTDGVGRDRYVLEARKHLGMTIDVDETYAWGWSEIERLWVRLTEVCASIDPTASVHDVVKGLASDPNETATSVEEFLDAMHAVQEHALEQLSGTHFDVPDQVRRIAVKQSPPGGALSPYYTGPSEDFSRPGTVWYPMGDRTTFPYWSEITTAYHEGFPGHHLQVGVQTTLGDRLSRYHRLAVWQPGSGEGWALYAENLMLELGYLNVPAHEVGFLAAQLLRACRIVVDIGVHCELAIPASSTFHPGEEWSFDTAVEMMCMVALQSEAVATSEVTRYLGWPGQAISYKIGERVLFQLREELQARPDFELKAFHTKVLSVGSIGLDLLRELVRAA